MKRSLILMIAQFALPLSFATAGEMPSGATEQSVALLPVRQFVENVNKGNLDAAFTACGEDMSILDNVAPFGWNGNNACAQWAAALESDAIEQGMTDLVFTLGEATTFRRINENAYAVLPASYTFRKNGAAGFGKGTFTVALRNKPNGWRMTAFSFSEQ